MEMKNVVLLLLLGLAQGVADDCYTKPVGISDQGKIPDNQMTASSQYGTGYQPAYGRLNGNRGDGWCAKEADRNDDWLQVDLGEMIEVCALATQGDRNGNEWTTAFKMSYSTDGNSWTPYKDANSAEVEFHRQGDSNTPDQHKLPVPVTARYLRFNPTQRHAWNCLRVEIYGTEIASKDPCNNYKSLNATDRLESFAPQRPVRCDQRDITPGWYRFTGVAGNPQMPTTCPPVRRCSTHAPGWIKGQHPSVEDGEVTREVCYHWTDNCCRWKNNIKVKNCGAFYVYQLQNPPGCSLRYCVSSNDPCSNYKSLNEANRLESFTGQNPVGCDKRDITPGWYRFTGVAGSPQMPTTCPPVRRCGTHAPGWIKGQHPSVADGEVTREVCYHWTNNCCRWKNNIKVKNCSAFYVYKLQKTPVCSLRYCVASKDPCSNYKTLNAADRLETFTKQSQVLCDQRNITPGWYRFTGVAGNPQMSTTCPPVRRCGTHAPGWIKGQHPSVAGGEVTREVCYHWLNNCCRWKNNIKVKNCGAFYVYELQKTPVCSLQYCVASNDPCSNYKTLHAPDRLETFTGQSQVRCDRRDITPGWYRFTGIAGNTQMPTTCPPVRRCGTHAPGWIKGQHPSVADREVTREVCYHWSNNCCRWKNNVKVKNCGAFYVYQLQKTPVCSLRYCVKAIASNNPCSKYKNLDAADRLVTFTDQSSVRCDQRDLTPGWYRFTGVAGNPKMPTTCPPVRRCSTHAPGWINGEHPSVADGEVTREVCYHWSQNCCRWKNNIKVKNCGAFHVYELPKTPVCSHRYCDEY